MVGVIDGKTKLLIERLYYNSTGLIKSYSTTPNQGAVSSETENLDDDGKNISRSKFVTFGWTGMYHEPVTNLYHTLYREYDAVHERWLSEDPAGYADGLNLYGAYFGVNGVDVLGLDRVNEKGEVDSNGKFWKVDKGDTLKSIAKSLSSSKSKVDSKSINKGNENIEEGKIIDIGNVMSSSNYISWATEDITLTTPITWYDIEKDIKTGLTYQITGTITTITKEDINQAARIIYGEATANNSAEMKAIASCIYNRLGYYVKDQVNTTLKMVVEQGNGTQFVAFKDQKYKDANPSALEVEKISYESLNLSIEAIKNVLNNQNPLPYNQQHASKFPSGDKGVGIGKQVFRLDKTIVNNLGAGYLTKENIANLEKVNYTWKSRPEMIKDLKAIYGYNIGSLVETWNEGIDFNKNLKPNKTVLKIYKVKEK